MATEEQIKELKRLENMKELRMLEMQKQLRQGEPQQEPQRGPLHRGRSDSPFGESLKSGFGNTVGGLQQLFGTGAAKTFGADNMNKSLSELMSNSGPMGPIMSPQMSEQMYKSKLAEEAAQRNQRYEKAYSEDPFGAFVGNITGSALSTAPLGALKAPQAAWMGAKALPSALQRLGARAGLGAAETGAQSGLAGALQYIPEEQSRSEMAAATALLGGGLGAFGQALRPSTYRGNPKISPKMEQQILENARVAQGTETPLGKITEAPFANWGYEFLQKLPFSGARNATQRTEDLLKNRGNELFEEMTQHYIPTEQKITSVLKEGLEGAKKETKKEVDRLYAIPKSRADELGVRISPEKFSRAAKDSIEELENNALLKESVPNDVQNKLKTFSGLGAESSSLSGFIKFRSTIGNLTREAKNKGESEKYSYYSKLLNQLDDDIEGAIAKTGDETLSSEWRSANNFYKEKYLPFTQGKIDDFITGKADKDTIINTFVNQGKDDREDLLMKLTDSLRKSPDSQTNIDALRYGLFSKAKNSETGQIEPEKLSKIYRSLGPLQRKELFSDMPNELKKLSDFENLNKMNSESISKLKINPQTGQALYNALGIAAPFAGYHYGEQQGGLPGGIIGGILGTGIGAGKYGTKRLTAEKYRNKTIDKLLNKKQESPFLDELSRQLARSYATTKTEKSENKKKPLKIEVTGIRPEDMK